MNIQISPRRIRRGQITALYIGISVALLGGAILTGWLFHIEALKTIFPGSEDPIKPNIATGFLLCGAALSLLSRKTLTNPIRICTAAIAITVIILSALTVGEYFFGWDLGIEQWLIGEVPAGLEISHPGRMSPLTALCFILVGVALSKASRLMQKRLRLSLVGGLGGTLVIAGAVPLIGFVLEMLFGPGWNYMGTTVGGLTGAVAFFLLGSGLLALLRGNAHLVWSLDRLTTAGFGCGLALMILAAGLMYSFTVKMQQTAGQESQAQEILRELEEVEVNLSDLERDQRSYIITANERVLEEWDVKEFEIRNHFKKLQKLQADDSHRESLLSQFAALVWKRVNWAKQTVEARRELGFPAAQEMVGNGTGILLVAESRGLIQTIEVGENARLRESQVQSELASRTAFLMLPLGVFICFAILSLVLFFLNAGVSGRKQAENSLRQSEEGMRAILDSALDCIITMDHHGRVAEFNPAAVKTFGYRREEAIGQLLSELIIPPSLRERHQKGLARYLATGDAPVLGQRLELSAVKRDGSEFPIELAIIRIGTQKPPMFTGFIRDITERKQAENALRQTEEKYRGIFENAVEGFFQTTPDGKFIAANRAFARMLGFDSPEELIRERTDIAQENYVNPQSREEFKRLLDENGSVLDFDLEAYRRDGSRIWLSENVLAVRDDKGTVHHYEGTAQDITGRKRAESALRASEERYRALFESNPSPMWVYDLETLSFLAVNAAAIKHYGYSEVEFLAMTIKDIRPPEDVPVLMEDLEQTTAALSDSCWRHRKKNGAVIDAEIASHELPWLGRRARVVLVHDITERKRAEENVQRLHKAEEDQRLAVEANRMKNEFLTTMSHELRTPLNSIIGFTGTMLMGLPGPITPAQKKQLETVKASARHQLSLINDLLDLAKIESGKVELRLEPIACEEVVQEVAETLRPVAENKGLALHVDLPAETRIAHAEKRALKQILINLVNNAIKFTEQGEVRIELGNGNKKTSIAVTDTGSGITEEDRLKLFKAFSRLEHTNAHREEGTGLGLHLSQKLAELMGGEIKLESEVGKGSTFTLVLDAESPLKEAA
jgi:PAS domain S-box-containing protein